MVMPEMNEEQMFNYHISWARSERNRRLAESDWTQMPDVALTQEQKQAWATYRQELRDLVNGITEVIPFEWPEKPTI